MAAHYTTYFPSDAMLDELMPKADALGWDRCKLANELTIWDATTDMEEIPLVKFNLVWK